MKMTEIDAVTLQKNARQVAEFLKNLGNEKRLMILCHLLEGELNVGQLNERINLSPSALSQHLACLRDAALVSTRRESQTIYYQLADTRVMEVMGLLKKLFCS